MKIAANVRTPLVLPRYIKSFKSSIQNERLNKALPRKLHGKQRLIGSACAYNKASKTNFNIKIYIVKPSRN